MRFLENLDDLLHVNKMSRSDLARAIGIGPSTVNAWFNRSCENVSLKSLVAVADYFKITLDDLVNGDLSKSAPANTESLTNDEIAQLKRLLTYADKIERGGNIDK